MFTKNTYLRPSLHSRVTSSVVDHNGVDEILQLHHHADSLFYGHVLGYNNAPLYEAADTSLLNQDRAVGLSADPADSMENTSDQMQPLGKKDRHSKIFTAQGPRDRRVRLSKGIARKFFDLQEMLGFDKPSKTLDWLLNKSRTAIRELLQTKQNGSSSSSPSECEVLSSDAGNGEYCFENGNYLAGGGSRKKLVKETNDSDQQQTGSTLAKESRAKARERARARTREKMCIKQLNEAREIRYQGDNHLDVFQLSAGSSGSNTCCLFTESARIGTPSVYHSVAYETENEGLIQESTASRRSTSAHQQSLLLARDLMIRSNYSTAPPVNATENWDFCSQSNLFAAWDQQKFINR